MTEVRPVRVRIRAPRIFAFQCVSTFDRSSPVWCTGFEPQILRHDGDSTIIRFRKRTLGRLIVSVARVRVRPPDQVALEQLDGALGGLSETLVLAADGDAASSLVWSADLDVRAPVVGGAVGRLVAARVLRSEAHRSLDRYRVTIEAAALAAGFRAGPL